jgi:hypothetical protein
MDVVIPSSVLALKAELGPSGLMVYICLAETANDAGETSVSYDVIAQMTGLSRAVIARSILLLASHHVIARKKRYSRSTIYTLVHYLNLYSSSSFTTELLINTTSINEDIKSSESELMNYNSSDNELMRRDPPQENPRMTDAQEAAYAFAQATGMMAIPGQDRERRIQEIGALVRQYGLEGAIEKLRACWQEWQTRTRQDGRKYSRLNTGWIDWAIAGEIPEPNRNGRQREEVFIDV